MSDYDDVSELFVSGAVAIAIILLIIGIVALIRWLAV